MPTGPELRRRLVLVWLGLLIAMAILLRVRMILGISIISYQSAGATVGGFLIGTLLLLVCDSRRSGTG